MTDDQNAVAEEFDIAVVGGGLVGLVLVRLLSELLTNAGSSRRIVLLESNPPGAERSETDELRVSAIAPVVHTILQNLGIWEQVQSTDRCAYTRMHVWQSAGAPTAARGLTFTAAELGRTELGHIVSNFAMRSIAWERLQTLANVRSLTKAKPAELTATEAGWMLTLDNGSKISARLLVAADGVNSWTRSSLGVEVRKVAHAQRAIVANISTQVPHGQTARQCFLSGGPLALLPLDNGCSSLVWSCPEVEAQELLDLNAQQFIVRLESAVGGVLGDMECISPRLSFPLASGHVAAYTGHRYALLGDAAHQVHPLAGQGLNLGILDAAVLAEYLAEHLQLRAADPGDRRVLRRFERARKGDNVLAENTLIALNSLFSSDMASAGGFGLGLIDRAGPVKNHLARYAMGQYRDLPSVAQPDGQHRFY
jgi:2-octaprenylphenol hydroxylase